MAIGGDLEMAHCKVRCPVRVVDQTANLATGGPVQVDWHRFDLVVGENFHRAIPCVRYMDCGIRQLRRQTECPYYTTKVLVVSRGNLFGLFTAAQRRLALSLLPHQRLAALLFDAKGLLPLRPP